MNHLAVFIISFVIFLLNDFLYIQFQEQYGLFILSDYLPRIFIISLSFKHVEFGKFTKPTKILMIVLMGVGVQLTSELADFEFFPNKPFYNFPDYPNQILRWLDLTLGLFLVALSEEFIFRSLWNSLSSKYGLNKLFSVVSGAVLFSLIHWSTGGKVLIQSFLWGAFHLVFFFKTRDLRTCILSHYISNFILFV